MIKQFVTGQDKQDMTGQDKTRQKQSCALQKLEEEMTEGLRDLSFSPSYYQFQYVKIEHSCKIKDNRFAVFLIARK